MSKSTRKAEFIREAYTCRPLALSVYNITVTGRTSNGDDYSATIKIRTDPEPAVISVQKVTSTGLAIEWSKVPEAAVYLTSIRDQEGSLVDQIRAHSIERFEYNGLSPYRQYKVIVSAQYGKFSSSLAKGRPNHIKLKRANR